MFAHLFHRSRRKSSGIPEDELPKVGDSVRIVGDHDNTPRKVVVLKGGGLKIFLDGITGDFPPDMLIKIETNNTK